MVYSIESVRQDFPALKNQVYLNSATLGLPNRHTETAIKSVMTTFTQGPGTKGSHAFWTDLEQLLQSAREQCGQLVNVPKEDIAMVQDTSSGINAALMSIPFESGDNIIFSDLEYPQIGLSAKIIQHLKGIETRIVPHRMGELTIDDYLPYIDKKTKAIIISSVQWVNGFKLDLEPFSQITRRRRIFLIVDSVQQLGVVPFDISHHQVDFLISGTHKWLNAPFNLGFMYINPQILDQLKPFPYYALSALDEPAIGWTDFLKNQTIDSFTNCRRSKKAKGFETNSLPRWFAGAGLNASLSYYNSMDREGAGKYVRELGSWFIEELKRRRCKIWTPVVPHRRAGIVSFLPEAHLDKLGALFKEQRIYLSIRYSGNIGGIRVSINHFNNRGDLENLLGCLDSIRQ